MEKSSIDDIKMHMKFYMNKLNNAKYTTYTSILYENGRQWNMLYVKDIKWMNKYMDKFTGK